jgi:hypothetical protein
MTALFIVFFAAQIAIWLSMAPVLFESPASAALIVYIITCIKSLVVTGLFRYRTLISERVLFFHQHLGVSAPPPVPASPVVTWRDRVGRFVTFIRGFNWYINTGEDFNNYHDRNQRLSIFNATNLMLLIDLVTSLATLTWTSSSAFLPSLLKCLLLMLSVIGLHGGWRLIERTDWKSKRFYLNFLVVSVVVVDHIAFWVDATWSLQFIPFDRPNDLIIKTAVFASTMATNIISLGASSIRLPWVTSCAILSVILAGISVPIHQALFPVVEEQSLYMSYYVNLMYDLMGLFILISFVVLLEARSLIRLYFHAFQNIAAPGS